MRRSSWVKLMAGPGIVLILLPVLTDVATGALPESWKPYSWVAWPLAILLASCIAVNEVGRHHADHALADPRPLSPVANTCGDQVWNIPAPVRTFHGRQSDLERLKAAFTVEQAGPFTRAVVALHGLAGIGKTQLALAHAADRRHLFRVGWLVPATERLTAVTAMAELAERLGVGDSDRERACRRVVEHLSARGDWLLIFDSAPDRQSLTGLVPVTGEGQVLITSVDPHWDTLARPMRVEAFSDADAIAFLRGRRGGDTTPAEEKALVELVDQLGGLPLALEQAAAYCTAGAIGWQEFMHRYRADCVNVLGRHLPCDYATPLTVTWRLTLRLIDGCNRAAGQSLRILAFYGPAPVPRDLIFSRVAGLPRALRRASADPVKADEVVATLLSCSLVNPADTARPDAAQSGATDLQLHQLVQTVIRDFTIQGSAVARPRSVGSLLERSWTSDRYARIAMDVLLAATPADARDSRHGPRFVALLPHVQALLGHADRLQIVSRNLATLQHIYGNFLEYRRHDGAARFLLERALQARLATLGARHIETLETMSLLGFALHRDPTQRRRSLDLCRQALTGYRRHFTDHHPATLTAITYLGAAFFGLEKIEQGRDMCEYALWGRRATLGDDHPDTLSSMNNLAVMLWRSGEFRRAKELAEQALQGRRAILGEHNPETLRSMNNMASALWGLGELEQARDLCGRALSLRLALLGPGHPDVNNSVGDLTAICQAIEIANGADGDRT